MRTRWRARLSRLAVVISTGMLVGEGCIGPEDLQEQFLASFNSMVYRAMEAAIANVFTAALPAA